MNLPRLIAWRYIRRPTDALVSAVGLVSVLGLIIGVMALVISMALMTGYRRDLQRKLLGGNAEIFVYSMAGPVTDAAGIQKTLGEIEGVAEASPVLFQQALVTTERNPTGSEVMIKGIEPSRARSSPMLARIVGALGKFETAEGEQGVAVGTYLATKLGVKPGDSMSITVPKEDARSILPRSSSFVVTNVFTTGFYEYDARWIFLDLHAAEQLRGVQGAANLFEVHLHPGTNLDRVVEEIDRRTGNQFAVSDWRDMNKNLFRMLELQQLVLFIVIGLIVFVSTFNIVSTLIMTVHEKRREIGILASMGADQTMLRRIFVWYGVLIGMAGTALGLLLGVAVCVLITRFELVSFPPEIAEVYFVSSIPFVNRWSDLAVIASFSLVVCFLATLAPSHRASRLFPVDALRHE